MAKLVPYLYFNGECEKAMNFYKDCFGGELQLMRAEGSEMEARVPPESRKRIIHASLAEGDFLLFASDSFTPGGTKEGDNVAISISFDTENDLRNSFSKVSSGGRILMPVQKPFWGGFYGVVTDKYGVRWEMMSQ